MPNFKYEDLRNFDRLSNILKTGESRVILNTKLGEIHIDKGFLGKNGYGLLHIIENRTQEGKKDKEISATIHLVTQAAQDGNKIKSIAAKDDPEKIRRIQLEKKGIIALISLQRNHDEEKWVLSGYANKDKKEEATEAIQTVIAQYDRTPEFSYFRKQVGAVVSSLKVSQQPNKKSREIETTRKAGYIQGVCECVAAIGDKHDLGKKLLTEMKVNKEMAKKYANPETYKTLEKGIFAPQPEQKLVQEQTNTIKR